MHDHVGVQDGDTPLHIAASTNATRIAAMLVEGGAAVDLKNEVGVPKHV